MIKLLSDKKIHEMSKKEKMDKKSPLNRKLFFEGKTQVYYENRGKPIIVDNGDVEYYFDSTIEATRKLGISSSKIKKIKRLAIDEDKDDFSLDCKTGLYWRCKDES